MNKSEVSELKKRFTKNKCTFTKMCGCYVNSEKHKIVEFTETFLNLDEDEFYKYLDIAKKTLSGSVGNNLLNLEFPLEEEQPGGRQQFLMGLKESKLQNEELLERFYELIINTYDYAGNYLILLFHDAYDVMKRSTDNLNLDESEEVYEYLLCAICPVELSKAALGYREEENRIGSRIRDWVVNVPDCGFLFPAFHDRSTDIHSLLFYTKDTKEPHYELMEQGFACEGRATATIQKQNFEHILDLSLGADSTQKEILIMDIQENLNDRLTEHVEVMEKAPEEFILDSKQLDELIVESNVPEEFVDKLKNSFEKTFVKEAPAVAHLLDARTLKTNAQKKEKMELVKQVASLNKLLEETRLGESELVSAVNTDNLIVKIAADKVDSIKSEEINGQKYIMIPLENEDDIDF